MDQAYELYKANKDKFKQLDEEFENDKNLELNF